MIGVIDTSALIRLFIPNGHIPQNLEEFFRGVERGTNAAIAPELLLVETANVLNKKRRLRELSENESAQLLTDILSMPIRFFQHGPLIPRAFDLAGKYNLTLYDSLYLSLAVEHGAVVFSADQKMHKAANALNLQ